MSSDSEPEVEPFITQTKVASVAVLQGLSENEQAVDNFNFRTEHLPPTCMFTDKEDSGRGISTRSYKEIQSRNEARIPQNTKRLTTCLHRVH